MGHDVCLCAPIMRIISTALTALFLLSAPLVACSASQDDASIAGGDEASSEDELKSLVLTEADNGRTINVPEGQNVVVKLSSNPSTGYDWVVASTDRTFGQPYYKRFLTASDAVGSGGVQRMTWRTKGAISMAGRHEVKLEYKRPSDTGPAARTFKFVVEIRAVVCPQIEPNPPGSCPDGELKPVRNDDGCFLGSRCVAKPPPSAATCKISGCNREICADQSLASICIALPESGCYDSAECKPQADGLCGWTMTPTLMQCLTSQGGQQ